MSQHEVLSAVTMKRSTHRAWLILGLTVLAIALPATCQITVILSRHAEKAASPPKDPPLSSAGEKRANLLASMLADAGVDAIYVTELQRTQQSAAPLAARTHVKPTMIPADDTDQLIKAIRGRQSGVVVVIGHSNKLPAIIAGLGGPKVTIPETEYDNLFVLTVGATQSSLLRMHYGSTIPAPPATGMMEPAKRTK
jgi:broad specificity phosphatase PhoE